MPIDASSIVLNYAGILMDKTKDSESMYIIHDPKKQRIKEHAYKTLGSMRIYDTFPYIPL